MKKCKRDFSNILLFTIGKTISLMGSSLYTFVIGLYILRVTNSGLSFATTLVLGSVPLILIGPLAGILSDRLDRKVLVISMDILNGVLLVLLYFISCKYNLKVWMIYVSTFMTTAIATVFNISIEAAKPNMVTEENLLRINSISKIIESISTILGPVLGGMLFYIIDMKIFILMNGISFIISAILEGFIDFRVYKKDEDSMEMNLINDIKTGFNHLIKSEALMSAFIKLLFINFSLGLSIFIPIPYVLTNIFKLDSKYFGIVQGFMPLGMIIGAILINRFEPTKGYGYMMKLSINGILIIIILSSVPVLPLNLIYKIKHILIYYSCIMLVLGLIISFIDIPLLLILQRHVVDKYRGRVMSLFITMVKIVSPISFIISGILIETLQPYKAILIGGFILMGFIFRHLR
ncbi:MFS transporter [Clostridiisalibacter paucivorans]|uniref:MFS transporter n=1 Tax=Clostridiisalibacter paucivorans TaxID=408753 RepID=UPI00054EC426|nr:MFS transporter [Clostridiisalibacter paucivorans]